MSIRKYADRQWVEEQLSEAISNLDIPEGFSGSWNDLTEKPFGKEVIKITWDGNLDSIETKVFEVEEKFNEDSYNIGGYFLVSDVVPSNEDLLQGHASCFYSDYYNDDGEYSFSIASTTSGGFPCAYLGDDHSIVFEPNRGDYAIVVVRRENVDLNGTIFPKTGIYFALIKAKGLNIYMDKDFYTTSLTIQGNTICLDEKFIPDTIARVSDIPSTDGLATETYVDNAVAAMVDSAPETLNTLNELAAALGDDPNFATTLATQIGALESKVGDDAVSVQINNAIANKTDVGHKHAAGDITSGTLEVVRGGTGYNSIVDTTYTTARYRASSLVNTETTPYDNGTICWTYE